MSKQNIAINKSLLKKLTELSRVKLTVKEEGKLLKDLRKIIGYFDEIKKLNVEKITPMAGGHALKNIFRDDRIDFSEKAQSTNETGLVIGGFRDEERGYLKVPKIL